MSLEIHKLRRLTAPTLGSTYPLHRHLLPNGTLSAGRYEARFAQSVDDLRAVQRLRFEVFNLELNEGLVESYRSARDEDVFDRHCHHLMVIERASGEVVGTYRMMCGVMALAEGFYSEQEFELFTMPRGVLRSGAEVGRACVRREHRNGRVLHLLWRGIARYLDWNDKRFLFGCCSVPTLDPMEAMRVHAWLEREGHLHESVRVEPVPATRCHGLRLEYPEGDVPDVEIPALMGSYLRMGARVVSAPALDHAFHVTDFLVVLDLLDLKPSMRERFLDERGWATDGVAAD